MATAEIFRSLSGSPDTAVLEALRGWGDDRLAALLAARPEVARQRIDHFGHLAQWVSGADQAMACRRRLDAWSAQVLDAVLLLGDTPTVPGLRTLLALQVDRADLDRALTHLDDLALVFRSGDRLHPVAGLRAVTYPAGLGPPGSTLLRASAGDLARTAKRLGATAGRSRQTALDAVLAALADPRVVAGVVATGPAGTDDLAATLIVHPAITVPGGTTWLKEATPVGWLAAHGILVAVSWSTMIVPREAGLALRGGRPFPVLAPQPPPAETVPAGQEAVDAAAADAGLQLVADVARALELVAEAPPALLKTGGIGVRDVRKLAKALGSDEKRTARLLELAGAVGLLAADRATNTALPLPAFDAWLAEPAARRWAALADGWLEAEVHPTVAGAFDDKNKPIPPLSSRGPDPEAATQRRMVLAALADAGEGNALTGPSLAAQALWAGPAVWALGPAEEDELIQWVAAEATHLGLCGLGGLATAGRRLLEGDREGAVAVVAARAPVRIDTIVIQADLSAVAAGELVPAVRAELELLADLESSGAATVYRFSEASLTRGLAAGRTAAEIMSFLEDHAAKALPQSLGYLVNDLGRRYGGLRAGQARCYLRSDDPALLAEVTRSRQVAGLGLRLLAPTVAVTDAEPAAVVARLRSSGYLAAEEDGAGALVVTRPEPRRATRPAARPRPARQLPPGPAPDPAAIVAAIRRAPEKEKATVGGSEDDLDATLARIMLGRFGTLGADELGNLLGFDDDCTCEECAGTAGFDDDCTCEECTCTAEPPRPTAVLRGQAEMNAALNAASQHDWMVRVGHAGKGGADVQVSAFVTGLYGRSVQLECAPRWKKLKLSVVDLRWVRVLTEAEEEAL